MQPSFPRADQLCKCLLQLSKRAPLHNRPNAFMAPNAPSPPQLSKCLPAQVGIGSTALTLGARTKPALAGFAAAQAACLLAAGAAVDAGSAYHAAVAASAAHQAWQILSTNLDDGPDCMRKFVSNKWYGAIMYGGIVADRLMAG